jgi:ABC-type nickel/cobalt efflux system permease component RcnA
VRQEPWTKEVEWVRGNALEPKSFEQHLDGAAAVISAVGAFGSQEAMLRVRTRVFPHTHVRTHIHTYLGLAKTIYIRCIYGNFGREITKYMVIYGVYIRFWPTLHIHKHAHSQHTHEHTRTLSYARTHAHTHARTQHTVTHAQTHTRTHALIHIDQRHSERDLDGGRCSGWCPPLCVY